jgi:2-isopropylmalate synthase
VAVIVGKASPMHVTEVLGTTLDENLAMIRDTVAYLRAAGREVLFDAEHFFDGYELDADVCPGDAPCGRRGRRRPRRAV